MTHRTLVIAVTLIAACQSAPAEEGGFTPAMPVEPQEPIPYPPSLFAQRIEGQVMLYLVIDSSGAVIPDSSQIAEGSGYQDFDAAALQAARTLRFTPARRGDTAVSAPIRVPIHFALPDSLRPSDAP
jgi:TonB family protein